MQEIDHAENIQIKKKLYIANVACQVNQNKNPTYERLIQRKAFNVD